MRLKRFLLLGCMVTAIALVTSCSDGEDGATGQTGPTGADGAAGANGLDGIDCWDLNGNGIADIELGSVSDEDINDDGVVDALDCQGTDGMDGNANVEKIVVDVSGVAKDEYIIPLETPELTIDVLQNNTLIVFIEASELDENDMPYPVFYPVPGVIAEPVNARMEIQFSPGVTQLLLLNIDGTDAGFWPEDYFTNLHITLIENPTLGSKNSQKDVMGSLKANGVDTNNYHEVMKYLGLQ